MSPQSLSPNLRKGSSRTTTSRVSRTLSRIRESRKLKALKDAGAKIYIVTNKRHAATQKIVRALGWDSMFDGVWSFDSIPEMRYGKPDLLARLLKDLDIAPEDAVMVGDTKGDIDAGRANGVYTIGVTWGYGSREELSEADELCELS